MKKFQSLNESVFNDVKLSSDQMKKIYGGFDGPTKIGNALTANCSTHTAGTPGGPNNDGCDTNSDAVYRDDPQQ